MGWNDHVDWELLADYDTVVEHDLVEPENEKRFEKVVTVMAYGGKLTALQQKVWTNELLPLLAQTEDLHRQEYMGYLMAKDD